jgi:UPF0042 nucleotide-binding protein
VSAAPAAADDGAPADGRFGVTVSSFGNKFGPHLEADWVVDVRMVRNPFWVDDLRPLTGLDERVREYVMRDPAAPELVTSVCRLLAWASPHYLERGRSFVHIAVGCTGGRHRSVVLSEAIAERLRAEGITVSVRHRDVHRPDPRD